MTTSDIVGAGRIIDKYIYQPGGRLVERAVGRVVAYRNTTLGADGGKMKELFRDVWGVKSNVTDYRPRQEEFRRAVEKVRAVRDSRVLSLSQTGDTTEQDQTRAPPTE